MAVNLKVFGVPLTFGRFDFFNLMDAPVRPATQNADVIKFEAPVAKTEAPRLTSTELRPAA